MTKVRYVFGVLTVVGLPPGIVWWFLVHPFVGFWRRVGVKGTLWAVGILMGAAVGGLFIVRDPLMGRDLGTSWGLAAAGAALIVAAIVLGAKRKKYLTLSILAGVPELRRGHPGKLLVEGPYAVIRHPRYVEVAAGMLGYSLVANWLGVYVVVLVGLLALHALVLMEERELLDRFGAEYAAYQARVPRYIPRRLMRSR